MNYNYCSSGYFAVPKMFLLQRVAKYSPFIQQIRRTTMFLSHPSPPPRHLICFKDWNSDMIKEIISSAITLKRQFPDTHGIRLPTLDGAKIMILQENNQPVLHMAVSKAATLMGAHDVGIVDKLVWEHDYMGRVFSNMADAIFVSTTTHWCVQRFAEQSRVPVLCMRSRTHSSIHALATIMAIVEEFNQIEGLNVGYLGPPHPILNSYLLLCPMLKANFKYKCCCDKKPVTPLLFKVSEKLCENYDTKMKACTSKEEVFSDTNVIIAGPATTKKDRKPIFSISLKDLPKVEKWIFIHVCPKGDEIEDALFNHDFARTYTVFENMQYIAAALMTNSILGNNFACQGCPM